MASTSSRLQCVTSLRPRQNGRRFADDLFKCIFMNENVRISIEISLKFVRKGPIDNIPALVQIMAWRRSGDKPLSEAMAFSLLTHICVTRPQWVQHLLNFIRAWIHKFNAFIGKIFYVKFYSIDLKFHAKYHIHIFIYYFQLGEQTHSVSSMCIFIM